MFSVGSTTGDVTVGAKSAYGKNEDDWKISLTLDAGTKISKEHKTDLQAIALSLVTFDVTE